jgi:prolyl-tRNA synthetase
MAESFSRADAAAAKNKENYIVNEDEDEEEDGHGAGSGVIDDLGFFLVPWKCDSANEEAIKEATRATVRCYPLDLQREAEGKMCFYSGDPATHMAIFARAF